MSKNIVQRKVSIDLNIKSATVQVPDAMEILIVWKRGKFLKLFIKEFDFLGTKKIDTRSKLLDPSSGNSQAVFNEKFQMKTVLDYDAVHRMFLKKKSDLQVWKKDMSQMLGTTEFDLGKYANDCENGGVSGFQEDRLTLKNCMVDQSGRAHIQIHIRAHMNEPIPPVPQNQIQSSSNNVNQSGTGTGVVIQHLNSHSRISKLKSGTYQQTVMPVIEERESESDVKEELEKKEKDYQRNIELLEETVDDLKRVYDASMSLMGHDLSIVMN